MRLILLALLLQWSAPAQAQPQCNDRESVVEFLASKYQERPVALGVTNMGGLVEVLTTENGDTWTIIVTTPRGLSCLVAAGGHWHVLETQQEDEEGL